jgi:predicted dinucleotide-binding enzyme
VNARVMVDPALVPGRHNIFVSGNDAGAKEQVKAWLGSWFGWSADQIIDLGDITSARGAEMMLPIWIRLFGVFGDPNFNWGVVR